MQSAGFKDIICSSPATLILAVLLLVASRFYVGGLDVDGWILAGGCIAIAFILQRISDTNGLIRVRSWMMPTVYLLLSTASHFVLKLEMALLCVPFYAIAIFFLLQSYQEVHAERWIFPSFFFLGIGCLFFHPLIWMIPVFLIVIMMQLHNMSMRILSSGILALLIIIEFTFIYLYVTNQSELVQSLLPDLLMFRLPALTSLKLNEILCFIIIMFLYIMAVVHFFSTSYDDKIQTRICFNILIFLNFAVLALFIFRPQDVNVTMQLLLFGISPIIAHYFILSRGVIANILFVYSIILLILLYIIGTWGSSLHI